MKVIYLVLFVSIIGMTFSVINVLTNLSIANAQTPTTSDLPANIGNESKSGMNLTKTTMPLENIPTVIPIPQ